MGLPSCVVGYFLLVVGRCGAARGDVSGAPRWCKEIVFAASYSGRKHVLGTTVWMNLPGAPHVGMDTFVPGKTSHSRKISGYKVAANSGFRMKLPLVSTDENDRGELRSSMVGDRSQATSDLRELRAAYKELHVQYTRLENSESSARLHLQTSASQLQELQVIAAKHKKGYDKYKQLAVNYEQSIAEYESRRQQDEETKRVWDKKLANMQQSTLELEGELRKATERAADMQSRWNAKIVEEEDLHNSLKTAVQQFKDEQKKRKDMEEQHVQLVDMQKKFEENLAAREELLASNQALSDRNEALSIEISALKEANGQQDLQKEKLKEMESAITELTRKWEEQTKELHAARKVTDEKDKWLEESRASRTQLAEELDQVKEQKTEMAKQIVALKTAEKVTAELVESQKRSLLDKERRVATLQASLVKTSEEDAEKKIRDEKAEDRILELERSLKISTASVVKLNDEVTKLKERSARAVNASLGAVETLALQEGAATRQKQGSDARVQQLELELKQSLEAKGELENQLIEAKEREKNLKEDMKAVQEMKRELIDVRAKQEFAVNEVKHLMSKLASYENACGGSGESGSSESWDVIDKNIQMLRRKQGSKKKRGLKNGRK